MAELFMAWFAGFPFIPAGPPSPHQCPTPIPRVVPALPGCCCERNGNPCACGGTCRPLLPDARLAMEGRP